MPLSAGARAAPGSSRDTHPTSAGRSPCSAQRPRVGGSPGYVGHITGITPELWMANALGPPQLRSKPPPHATPQLEAPASLGSPWELGSQGGQSGRAGQSGQEQSRGRAACRQGPAVMGKGGRSSSVRSLASLAACLSGHAVECLDPRTKPCLIWEISCVRSKVSLSGWKFISWCRGCEDAHR